MTERPDWLLGYAADGSEVRHIDPPPLGRRDPLAEPAGYGVKVDQTPRPDMKGHDTHTQCDIWREGMRCPNDRTHYIWIGCLREHLGPICICDEHPELPQVLQSLGCQLCANAGDKQLMYLIKEEPIP